MGVFCFCLEFFGFFVVCLCGLGFFCCLSGVFCLVGFFGCGLFFLVVSFSSCSKCLFTHRFLFIPIFLVTGFLHNSTSELKAENSDM